jgi:hypothetical protein
MKYQCTKNMLDNLGLKSGDLLPRTGDEDSFFAWHVNYCIWNRRKVVMAMNNLTHYCVFLYRPKPKDMKNLKELLAEAIRTSFLMEGYPGEVVDRYFALAGEVVFSQSANSSLIASMKSCERIAWMYPDFLKIHPLIQPELAFTVANGFLSRNEGSTIRESLKEAFRVCCGYDGPVSIKILAYQLKVTLQLEGVSTVSRRMVVPANFSFSHLHDLLQKVFEWQDCHLHEFSTNDDFMIIMDDLVDDELYGEAVKARKESEILLNEVFSTYKACSYLYDFGDSWEHEIEVEKVVFQPTFKAMLLEMVGEAPPEDCGGVGGYENKLRILSDPSNEEYWEIKAWTEWRTSYRYFYAYNKDRLPVVLVVR